MEIMELIFEILFELIFEGSFELAISKESPTAARIIGGLIFGAVAGGVVALLFFIALEIMKKNAFLGWLLILFDLFLAYVICRKIYRKVKTR